MHGGNYTSTRAAVRRRRPEAMAASRACDYLGIELEMARERMRSMANSRSMAD